MPHTPLARPRALQLELCSLTAKSLTAVFLQSGSFFLQSGSRTCSLAPLFLQSGSALAVWLAKKSQTATKKSQTAKTTEPDCKPKRQKGEKGGQKQPKTARLQPNTEPDCKKSCQPDCSQIPFLPSQTAEQSQTAAPVPPPGCSGWAAVWLLVVAVWLMFKEPDCNSQENRPQNRARLQHLAAVWLFLQSGSGFWLFLQSGYTTRVVGKLSQTKMSVNASDQRRPCSGVTASAATWPITRVL